MIGSAIVSNCLLGSLNQKFRGLLFTTSTEEKSQEFSCILEYAYGKATRTAEQEYAFISRQFCLNQTSLCPTPQADYSALSLCVHNMMLSPSKIGISFKTSLISTEIFSIPDLKVFGCCHTQ